MAELPEYIEIKPMKALRNGMLGGSGVCGFVAWGALQGGHGGTFLIMGAAGAILLYIATKIKTTKKLKRYGGVYE
ncbi:hypothetical protein [Pontivivens ytuae]|uniref:Uncharacterized protein n=1 Tax=Pontivivens ytuae TaxID=2789856 RepID=A0A7S9LT07_9RHOB|nr:hypothetical protein [Pontivivens ytuae]QPH54752.1 hypothetical protein I0K15_02945 [Pontivivens ytuae]